VLARGKEIYETRCAVCHGEQGDGKGPAAVALPVKPPSFRDAKMVNEMAGNYWFWRISEGGLIEPFSSMGSVMPAWKEELSVEDRWAVIAYTHRFSGHEGPHVTSEHPEMLATGHAAERRTR
jgi:high-affinity iron transporter